MTPSQMLFFSVEMQKVSGMPQPSQAQLAPPPGQTEKKKSGLSKYVNPMTIGGSALALGSLALGKPGALKAFGQKSKDIVANPKAALQRGFRSGSSKQYAPGTPGAREAASKRVEMMTESFDEALGSGTGGARLKTWEALERPDSMRAGGWGSAGARYSDKGVGGKLMDFIRGEKGQTLDLGEDLTKRVTGMRDRIRGGEIVDEAEIRKVYDAIKEKAAAQGLTANRRGYGYYLPGERTVDVGFGTVGGVAMGAPAEDPETGRKRGVAERIARGTIGGYLGLTTAPLMTGRAMQLSGLGKAVLPVAAGAPIMAATEAAADAGGSGAALIDSAFGQKKS